MSIVLLIGTFIFLIPNNDWMLTESREAEDYLEDSEFLEEASSRLQRGGAVKLKAAQKALALSKQRLNAKKNQIRNISSAIKRYANNPALANRYKSQLRSASRQLTTLSRDVSNKQVAYNNLAKNAKPPEEEKMHAAAERRAEQDAKVEAKKQADAKRIAEMERAREVNRTADAAKTQAQEAEKQAEINRINAEAEAEALRQYEAQRELEQARKAEALRIAQIPQAEKDASYAKHQVEVLKLAEADGYDCSSIKLGHLAERGVEYNEQNLLKSVSFADYYTKLRIRNEEYAKTDPWNKNTWLKQAEDAKKQELHHVCYKYGALHVVLEANVDPKPYLDKWTRLGELILNRKMHVRAMGKAYWDVEFPEYKSYVSNCTRENNVITRFIRQDNIDFIEEQLLLRGAEAYYYKKAKEDFENRVPPTSKWYKETIERFQASELKNACYRDAALQIVKEAMIDHAPYLEEWNKLGDSLVNKTITTKDLVGPNWKAIYQEFKNSLK